MLYIKIKNILTTAKYNRVKIEKYTINIKAIIIQIKKHEVIRNNFINSGLIKRLIYYTLIVRNTLNPECAVDIITPGH